LFRYLFANKKPSFSQYGRSQELIGKKKYKSSGIIQKKNQTSKDFIHVTFELK
jgi:hypothetical protein